MQSLTAAAELQSLSAATELHSVIAAAELQSLPAAIELHSVTATAELQSNPAASAFQMFPKIVELHIAAAATELQTAAEQFDIATPRAQDNDDRNCEFCLSDTSVLARLDDDDWEEHCLEQAPNLSNLLILYRTRVRGSWVTCRQPFEPSEGS